MPWFCHTTSKKKKKRSSKTHVTGVGKIEQEDSTSLSNGRPVFAVVLHGFSASAMEELSVQRGQVVEIMYFNGDWVFVRNMDSSSGYVPKTYCLSIDKVKGNFNNTLSQVSSCPPLPRPQVFNVDTHRSGSSTNSVEVHQVNNFSGVGVNDGPNPMDNSTSHTTSSSQVIYEVPRSPVRPSHGGDVGNSVRAVEVHPTQQPPFLPPRSLNLPSPADLQRQRSAQTPGSGQNPFMAAMQAHGAGQSPVESLSQPHSSRSHTSHSSNHSPHNPARNSPAASHTHGNFFPHSSSTGAHHSPLTQSHTPFPPTSAHPATSISTSSTSHANNNNPFNALRNVNPAFTSSSSHSPSSAPNPSGRHSSMGNMHPQSFGHVRPDFSSAVAGTPGSAGIPANAHSPTTARVAMTPGSPGVPPSSGTPGSANKPKFAATPPGATGTGNSPQWPRGAVPDFIPPNGHGVSTRRYRRYSSDALLLNSTISEDSNAVSYIPPHVGVSRQRMGRLSQPCMAAIGLHNSPPRRPTRLPVRRTLSMQERKRNTVNGETGSCVTPTRSVPIHRAASYQEAVLGEDERKFGYTAGIKPSELIDSSVQTSASAQERGWTTPGGREGQFDACRNADTSDPGNTDDVFLPGSNCKKPFGIYRCIRTYQQKFKGEISLKKNELVIIMDRGRGEWAWAITSNNNEGLIPKSVLVRYHSDLGVGGWVGPGVAEGRQNRANASTQTVLTRTSSTSFECPDGGGVSCSGTVASCSAATIAQADSSSSIPTDFSSPASIPTQHHKRKKTDLVSVSLESTPKEWFDTLDSVDAAKVVSSIKSKPSPTLSSSDQLATARKATATATHQATETSQRKPDATSSKKRPSAIPRRKKAASISHSTQEGVSSDTPVLVRAGTAHYHDRISGLGSVSFDNDPNNPLAKPNQHHHMALKPSSILTAIKDYTPPASSKNCLALTRGDVLHSQPHMHYPKGWMWVWHEKRRGFGYVPKSYVAYTYDTPPRERQRTESVEDAV